MGIREEIEKLDWAWYFSQETEPTHNKVVFLDHVLSILDEHLGELVAEHSIGQREPAAHRIMLIDQELYVKGFLLNPGNHISIYRREK